MAIWTPKRNTAEIAGELLIARSTSGRTVVEFTKTPFPFAIAQTAGDTWQVEFPAMNKRYTGRGTPPGRIGWLFLAKALEGHTLPKPWLFTPSKNGDNWRLENTRTGEVIEGFLNP